MPGLDGVLFQLNEFTFPRRTPCYTFTGALPGTFIVVNLEDFTLFPRLVISTVGSGTTFYYGC
jgi:hypothetical protein